MVACGFISIVFSGYCNENKKQKLVPPAKLVVLIEGAK